MGFSMNFDKRMIFWLNCQSNRINLISLIKFSKEETKMNCVEYIVIIVKFIYRTWFIFHPWFYFHHFC